MTGKNSEVSSENSNTSFNSANYSSLLQAFYETHEEANRLALSNNRLKSLNNWLEGRVKQLEDEIKSIFSLHEFDRFFFQNLRQLLHGFR